MPPDIKPDLTARAEHLKKGLGILQMFESVNTIDDLLKLIKEQAQQIATLEDDLNLLELREELKRLRRHATALEAQVATLTQERDEKHKLYIERTGDLLDMRERAEAAEAQRDDLLQRVANLNELNVEREALCQRLEDELVHLRTELKQDGRL